MNKENKIVSNFHIINTGCPRRSLDAERIRSYVLMNGQKVTNEPRKADYVILVSCGLEFAEKKVIGKIKELKKFKGELILCGCLPGTNPNLLKENFKGKVISTKELGTIDLFFPEFKVRFNKVPDANKGYDPNQPKAFSFKKLKRYLKNRLDFYRIGESLESIKNFLRKFRESAGIKRMLPGEFFLIRSANKLTWIDADDDLFSIRISEGCLGNCSYCTIKNAIGTLKSKPVSEILHEVRKAISQKRFKLCIQSSDAGSYGLDIGTTFPKLLKVILKEDSRLKFEFIQDLHPQWICKYKDFFIELSKIKKINSILTAFQSGSPKILKLMKRPNDLREYITTLKEMKKANPRFTIRTQIIVGFPSETEKDFIKTLDVIKRVEFKKVDIFPYYETEMMESAPIKPKISQKVKEERVKRLKEVTSNYYAEAGWEN